MYNNDFETPDSAPEAVNNSGFIDNPISREIFYKSGKAQVYFLGCLKFSFA